MFDQKNTPPRIQELGRELSAVGRSAVIGSAIALGLALAACGSAAGTPSSPASARSQSTEQTAQKPVAVASGEAAATWDQVLAAAKKEGTLTLGGPPQDAERSVIMKFRQAYPDIKLEYTGTTSDQLMPRLEAERAAGTYAWDAFVGGVSTQYPYIPKGFFQPFKEQVLLPDNLNDANWLAGFDGGFADKGKKYVYTITSYVTSLIKVNRTAVPESQLNTAQELLDPKWKGKIVIYDPRAGGAGTLAMSALRRELGEDALPKLLVDQQPVLSTDKRQFTEWVVRARYPIGIGVVDPYLAPFLDEGLGKDVKTLPTRIQVLTPGSGGVVVIDHAPHPNAAKVFVNWLLSKDVQADWAKTADTNSRRLDVPAGSPETKPNPARLKDYIDFNSETGNPFMRETQSLSQKLVQ